MATIYGVVYKSGLYGIVAAGESLLQESLKKATNHVGTQNIWKEVLRPNQSQTNVQNTFVTDTAPLRHGCSPPAGFKQVSSPAQLIHMIQLFSMTKFCKGLLVC